MKNTILILILTALILGCTSKKKIVYFQDIDQSQLDNVEKHSEQLEIKVNDILDIKVKTLNPESAIPFNPQNIGGAQNIRLDIMKINGYLVKKDGTIEYPELGTVKVKGKSTQEVQNLLKYKLKPYLKNPIVNVRVVNYKFTILGEVKSPGTYEILEENYTLLQALGRAGGLTINGKRKNILLIRHENGERITKRIDLTSSDWMNTRFYFIKQNDQIYVEPNNPKVKRAGFITNVGTALSVFSTILSLTIIIFR